jgi:arrestin-related trafficking adapter 4/5/7
VFYGDQHEAEPVTLSGSVVLNNPDHMNVRNIKIKLEGRWRVSWAVGNTPSSPPSQSSQMSRDRGTVLSEEQTFIPAPGEPVTTHRIAPGRHEWRFSFVLDPSLPESVEGLSGNFVVYNLAAELDRGYMSKNILARKHVRIVRTLSRDMTETVPFPYVSLSYPAAISGQTDRL